MLKIKTPDIDSPVAHLSGGNQQKVVLGKWLLKDSAVLILDEPTRGIDVGAKYEIYKFMSQIVKQKGKGIIIIPARAGFTPQERLRPQTGRDRRPFHCRRRGVVRTACGLS